jgi:hypothetical protein
MCPQYAVVPEPCLWVRQHNAHVELSSERRQHSARPSRKTGRRRAATRELHPACLPACLPARTHRRPEAPHAARREHVPAVLLLQELGQLAAVAAERCHAPALNVGSEARIQRLRDHCEAVALVGREGEALDGGGVHHRLGEGHDGVGHLDLHARVHGAAGGGTGRAAGGQTGSARRLRAQSRDYRVSRGATVATVADQARHTGQGLAGCHVGACAQPCTRFHT